ncbi:type II secretion system protein [Tissierella sp.]|uniref:type II secretion system protein n=1 Tax=Tissierella sp. TaxID=41274 RepID=UPI00285BF3C7|nr:type II secretion system protein [Tissierella sp.]MDR7856123.1 type II secretion system protein [Tissierella sp.]
MLKEIIKRRNKKGFTLVELLAVIAILGILAAIAVPKFNDVTDNAKKTAAVAEHKVIVSAFQMFQAASPSGSLPAKKADLVGYLDIEDSTDTDENLYTTKNATHEINWSNGMIKTKLIGKTDVLKSSTLK